MLVIPTTKIPALTSALIAAGCKYQLGAKADPLDSQPALIHALDCSGFVRWAVFHASMAQPGQAPLDLPDGSVQQHDWSRAALAPDANDSGRQDDGILRIAFLAPSPDGEPGHVMLIQNGLTCECYGHHGPGRRTWDSLPFMRTCEVYRLAQLV